MNTLLVRFLDGVPPWMGEGLQRFLTQTFALDTQLQWAARDLSEALDQRRGQYESTAILRMLLKEHKTHRGHVLGVTTVDLYVPMLSFLFGHAQLEGKVALVSLARLRQEFYGLKPDHPLALERLQKEAAHELGHTFGMKHCLNAQCCMSLSTAIEQVDTKRAEFCGGCRSLLRELVAAERSASVAEGKEEVPS